MQLTWGFKSLTFTDKCVPPPSSTFVHSCHFGKGSSVSNCHILLRGYSFPLTNTKVPTKIKGKKIQEIILIFYLHRSSINTSVIQSVSQLVGLSVSLSFHVISLINKNHLIIFCWYQVSFELVCLKNENLQFRHHILHWLQFLLTSISTGKL